MKQSKHHHLGSWLSAFIESLKIAATIPVILWLVIGIVGDYMAGALFFIFIGGTIHLLCYAVLGITFYKLFWHSSNNPMWRWYVALPTGGVLGAIPFWLYALLANPHSIGSVFQAGLWSAPYGVISALASVYVRWKRQHDFADAEIYLETEIDAPIERVFDFARSIDVHTAGASQTGERAIGEKTSGLVEWGDEITWEGRHFGLKQTLSSKVTQMKAPVFFEDQMTRGAFQSMRHRHRFVVRGDRTVMIDEFLFKAPLGILGRLAEKLFLTAYMRRFLLRKNAKLKQIAESEDWRKFL